MSRLVGIALAAWLLFGGLAPATAGAGDAIEWKFATLVPKNFPVFGTGAQRLADDIERMSGGRLHIKVYGAGELVSSFEIFDAVSRGTVEMGQGGPYFWKGKLPAAQFLSAVPFGMTAQEMYGWLYFGGGLALWQALYAPFGVLPVPTGNTGVQMAGWFNKPINTLADLKGLNIRMPGLGGEVLARAGANPALIPGVEMFAALQAGTIDAADWIGPFNDRAFGLQRAAHYYYWPGWQEPGAIIETLFNKKALAALPADLQAIVKGAAEAQNITMLADFTAHNPPALRQLIEQDGVDVRPLPPAVLNGLRQLSRQAMADLAASDEPSRKLYDSIQAYLARARPWQQIGEQAYLNARLPPTTAE